MANGAEGHKQVCAPTLVMRSTHFESPERFVPHLVKKSSMTLEASRAQHTFTSTALLSLLSCT